MLEYFLNIYSDTGGVEIINVKGVYYFVVGVGVGGWVRAVVVRAFAEKGLEVGGWIVLILVCVCIWYGPPPWYLIASPSQYL